MAVTVEGVGRAETKYNFGSYPQTIRWRGGSVLTRSSKAKKLYKVIIERTVEESRQDQEGRAVMTAERSSTCRKDGSRRPPNRSSVVRPDLRRMCSRERSSTSVTPSPDQDVEGDAQRRPRLRGLAAVDPISALLKSRAMEGRLRGGSIGSSCRQGCQAQGVSRDDCYPRKNRDLHHSIR